MEGFLDVITVVDISTTVSGPFCSFYLADMGAEVIKIEDPITRASRR